MEEEKLQTEIISFEMKHAADQSLDCDDDDFAVEMAVESNCHTDLEANSSKTDPIIVSELITDGCAAMILSEMSSYPAEQKSLAIDAVLVSVIN